MGEWRAVLSGEKFDLDYLVEQFPSGDPRVSVENGGYYLESGTFAECEGDADVLQMAQRLLRGMNAAARVTRSRHHQVYIASLQLREIGKSGHYVLIVENARHAHVTDTVTLSMGCAPESQHETPIFSRTRQVFHLYESDPDVRKLLDKLWQENDWASLYIIHEDVCSNLGRSKNKAEKRMDELGWLSMQDARSFRETADPQRHGGKPDHIPKHPMALDDARRLIRRMVDRWLERKLTAQGADK